MPLTLVAEAGIMHSGLTNVLNVSIISPLKTRAAPTSMILSLYGFRPVVSKSIITNFLNSLRAFFVVMSTLS